MKLVIGLGYVVGALALGAVAVPAMVVATAFVAFGEGIDWLGNLITGAFK